MKFLGLLTSERDAADDVRLRVTHKSHGVLLACPATGDSVDLESRLGASILADPATTVRLTVTVSEAVEHAVPPFKPAWMKRAAHIRRWVEGGVLPPETDYAEAVNALTRCFFFETSQSRKAIRDLRQLMFTHVVTGRDRAAVERISALLDDVFAQFRGLLSNSPAMNAMFDLHMMVRYLDFQKRRPRQELARRSTAAELRDIDTEAPEFAKALADLESLCRNHLPLGAAHLHLGHLASLRGDRTRAVAAYERASAVFPDVLDPGAATYPIGSYQVPTGSENELLDVPRLHWLQSSDPRPVSMDAPVIVYSGDPRFLKRYFPQVAFYMALFPEFTYHVHVVAELDDAEETMDLCNDLLHLILTLRDMPADAVTIDWSRSSLPDDVGSPITYYACARYLMASQLMDTYGADVWIHDVDLLPTGDIREVPDRVGAADVMLHMNHRMNGVIPWRRYLAGNVLIRRTDNGRAFLTAVADYLREFLSRGNSWCLDQNALTYGVEAAPHETEFVNTTTVGAPLTQGKLPGVIEA